MDARITSNLLSDVEFTIQFSNFLCLGDGCNESSTHSNDEITSRGEHLSKKQKLDSDDENNFGEETDVSSYMLSKKHNKGSKKTRREIYKNTTDDIHVFRSDHRVNKQHRGLALYPREIITSTHSKKNSNISPLLRSVYDDPILIGFSLADGSNITNICVLSIPRQFTSNLRPDEIREQFRERDEILNELIAPCYTFKLVVKSKDINISGSTDDFLILNYKYKDTPIKYYEFVSVVEKIPYSITYKGIEYNGQNSLPEQQQSSTKIDNQDVDLIQNDEIDIAQNVMNTITWITISPMSYFLNFVRLKGAETGVFPLANGTMKCLHTCSEYFKISPRARVYHFLDILHVIDIATTTQGVSYVVNALGDHFNRNVKNVVYKSTIAFIQQVQTKIKADKTLLAQYYTREKKEGKFCVINTDSLNTLTELEEEEEEEVDNDSNEKEFASVLTNSDDSEKNVKKVFRKKHVHTTSASSSSYTEQNAFNSLTHSDLEYADDVSDSKIMFMYHVQAARKIGLENSEMALAKSASKKGCHQKYELNVGVFTPLFGREFISILDEYIRKDGKVHPDIKIVTDNIAIFKDICRPTSYFLLVNYLSTLERYMFETHFKAFKNTNVHNYLKQNKIHVFIRNIFADKTDRQTNPWVWISQCCEQIPVTFTYDDRNTQEKSVDINTACLSNFYTRLIQNISSETPYIVSMLIASSYMYSESVWTGKRNYVPPLRYNIHEWCFRIPKIYESFCFLFSDKNLEIVKKFGGSIDSVMISSEKHVFFKDYSAKFMYCCNTLGFIITSLVLVKYHLQKNKTSSGSVVFFNKFDTFKKFIEDSAFLNIFCLNSKYPLMIYRLLMVMISETHHQFSSIVSCFVKEAKLLHKNFFSKVSTHVFNFKSFAQSVMDVSVNHIIEDHLKSGLIALNSVTVQGDLLFPGLFKKLFIQEDNENSMDCDSSLQTQSQLPVTNHISPASIFDVLIEKTAEEREFEQAQKNLDIFYSALQSAQSSTTSTSNVCTVENKNSSDGCLISTHMKILSSTDTNKSYFEIPMIIPSSEIERRESKMYFSIFAKIKPDYEVPEYVVANSDVVNCAKYLAQFLFKILQVSVNSNSKHDKIKPRISDLFSFIENGRLISIYQTKFSSLNFLHTLQPEKTSEAECLAFENILKSKVSQKTPTSSTVNTLIITTYYGNRKDAFVNLIKKMAGETPKKDNKENHIKILTVETILKRGADSLNEMFKKHKFHNLLLDCMHCWTLEECKKIFELMTKCISKLLHSECRLFFTSNSNTNKDFGYDITKDISRFIHSVTEMKSSCFDTIVPLSDVGTHFDTNVSKISMSTNESYNINLNIMKQEYFKISQKDEIFDVESRKEQLDHNNSRFNYLYVDPSKCRSLEKKIDRSSMSIEKIDMLDYQKRKKIDLFKSNVSMFKSQNVTLVDQGGGTPPTPDQLIDQKMDTSNTMGHSTTKKRKLQLLTDSNSGDHRLYIDDVCTDWVSTKQRRVTYHPSPLDSSLLDPKYIKLFTNFLINRFKNKHIVVVVGYKIIENYFELKELEKIIKEYTSPNSELVSFYNWCCRGNYLRKYKETTSVTSNVTSVDSVLLFAIDDIDRMSVEVHNVNLDTTNPILNDKQKITDAQNDRLSKDEIKERMCYAINRAVEQCHGKIYLESTSSYINSIFTEISKDDSTKAFTKTVYCTGRGQKTSIIFEYLCDLVKKLQ